MTAWTPCLDGAWRARALALLERISSILLATERVEKLGPHPTIQRAALFTGLPGQAIAHGYAARVGLGEQHESRAEELMEQALDEVAELHGEGSLSRGYCGPAFALEHLYGEPDHDDMGNAEVDAALLREVRARHDLPVDVMLGLAGRAIYARERVGHASGAELLAVIADRLVTTAERGRAGAAWRRMPDPRYEGGERSRQYPEGWFDLGIAWGHTGAVAVLASSADERARDTAREGMAWMWAQHTTDDLFPLVAGEAPSSTTGWCNGPIGLGAVMFEASRQLGDPDGCARWLAVLCSAARREPEPTRGLPLCHGAAGVAHAFDRVAQRAGSAQLRDAATRWYSLAIELGEQTDLTTDRTGFLDGLAGVALALIAATTDLEPSWDRLLLLS